MEEGEKEFNNEVIVERDERMIKVLYFIKFNYDIQFMSECIFNYVGCKSLYCNECKSMLIIYVFSVYVK